MIKKALKLLPSFNKKTKCKVKSEIISTVEDECLKSYNEANQLVMKFVELRMQKFPQGSLLTPRHISVFDSFLAATAHEYNNFVEKYGVPNPPLNDAVARIAQLDPTEPEHHNLSFLIREGYFPPFRVELSNNQQAGSSLLNVRIRLTSPVQKVSINVKVGL